MRKQCITLKHHAGVARVVGYARNATAGFVGLGPVNKTAQLDDGTAQRVLYGAKIVNKMIIPNWDGEC
jgi:hypothetical protein